MLAGAALPNKFWPYAFHHFLRIYNVTVHGDKKASPFELCSGRKPDFSLLRVFGCRVYALPTRPRRPDKLVSDSRTGIFLGFAKTLKNIIYFDIETETIKTAQHVIFDESMQDTDQPPPNARLLAMSLDHLNDIDFIDLDNNFPDIDITLSPFTKLDNIVFETDFDNLEHPLGFDYQQCPRLHRPYISTLHQPPTPRLSLRVFRNKYTGAFLTAIDDTPVFCVEDIDAIIRRLKSLREPPPSITITLAPERLRDINRAAPPPLHLRHIDLEHIDQLLSSISSLPYTVNRLQTDGMTPEERALPRFTRRYLKTLPNWDVWDLAFDAQLDAHLRDGAIGEPVPRSLTNSKGGPPNILRFQWSNCVKTDGRRKTRACLDGSKRAAPWLRDSANTYASCIEHQCMKLFFALAAYLCMIVTYGDVDNAYQNSPSPTEPCYIEADEAYRSWYYKRTGRHINPRTHVIPALRAIQGHPEAGRLFQELILKILQSPPLNFTTTVHERNLYRGLVDGALVIVARQVDDFAIGSHCPSTANRLIEIINSQLSTKNQGMIGLLTSYGLLHRYNGLDVHQTNHYIKISCETYIQRVLQTHGWESPGPKETDRPDSVPLHPDVASKLAQLSGPDEGTIEYQQLADSMKFSYRQLLGELIYAYILVRVDIGFAVCFLARFSSNPHQEHYTALKNIARYLRRTFDWGILYWRRASLPTLPEIPFTYPPIDTELPPFPTLTPGSLTGFVDASHAACLRTRRSITGYAFCFGSSVIAYKSKVQPVVATSSTEAEFYAAVIAAKLAKYFRSILDELGFPIHDPTPLYEDNEAAIAMINDCRPTPRVRHLDTQYFAIQEWRQAGLIQMFHIPGIINPADQQTKPLASRLHNRHVRRLMGHYGSG
jgi:hypothetical protein